MCDPITLTGAALAAGGGLVTGLSNQRQVDAQNKENRRAAEISRRARAEEMARQRGLEGRAAEEWISNLETVGADDQQQESQTAADALLQQFDTMRQGDGVSGQLLSGQDIPTGSTEVKEMAARKVAEASQQARERIAALFNLTGDQTAQAGVGRNFSQTGGNLQTIGNLRRGSLGASQLEQSIPGGTVKQGIGPIIGSVMQGAGGAMIGSPGMVSNLSSLFAQPSAYDFRMGFATPPQRA